MLFLSLDVINGNYPSFQDVMPILVITEEPAILKVTIHITHAGVHLVAGVTTVKKIC